MNNRGRPKGSKNKPKQAPPKHLTPYLFQPGVEHYRGPRCHRVRAAAFNRDYVLKNIIELMTKPADELTWMVKQKQVSAFQQMIIAAIIKAVNTGDPYQIDFLLARTIGTLKKEDEDDYKKTFADMVRKAKIRKDELDNE